MLNLVFSHKIYLFKNAPVVKTGAFFYSYAGK